MPSSHLILSRPLLLLPPIPPSIRVFSNESTLPMRWPKYWSFSFSIIPSKENPGLISFRMDWLDLLAVQGILKWLGYCKTHNNHWTLLEYNLVYLVPFQQHWFLYTHDTVIIKDDNYLFAQPTHSIQNSLIQFSSFYSTVTELKMFPHCLGQQRWVLFGS